MENDSKGNFSIATGKYAPELANAGMVTDAEWIDYDKDGDLDFVVVGEWMPVTLFQNTGESLVNVTRQVGLAKTNGWWNCVLVDDLNEDGYMDLIAGNWGLNSKIRASESEPASIYISDFDNNGRFEQILCYYKPLHDKLTAPNVIQEESIQTPSQTNNEFSKLRRKSYPMPLRPDLMKQLPYLQQKFPRHADYAGKQVMEIFTETQLSRAVVKKAYTFATTVFWGKEDGTFLQQPLPAEAQFSPVYAIMAKDFDADGAKDLLLAGNFYGVNPQLGRYDASYGTLLKGDGTGSFAFVPIQKSGLSLTGQVRDMVFLPYRNKQSPRGFGDREEIIIFAKNDGRIQVYEITGR
ncbi:MAG: FG-GAP repeat domain-containing protein [bacterium]